MNFRQRARSSRSRARLPALLAATWLGLSLPALSAAAPPPASEGDVATSGAAGQPGARPAAVAPAEGQASPAPQPGGKPAATAASRAAPEAQATLALVLPLESPTFGRAAEAVRAGFAAAAGDASGYKVIGHGDGGVRAALDKARAAGVQRVVGPLVRDDLRAIADSGAELPLTIALNQLEEGSSLPPRVYTLTLSVESEGSQLARQAWAYGARSVAIIESDAPLQKRLAGAFVGEWILCGGDAPTVFRFDRSPEMLALLRRELQRTPHDAVLLALDVADATLAKAYVGEATTYAGSQVNDRATPDILRDLDGLLFAEIPWRADPTGGSYASLPRPGYGSATLDRLYALGIDAYRVAQAFAKGPPATLAFDGATGHVTLERNRQFARESTMLQFRDGEVIPAGAP